SGLLEWVASRDHDDFSSAMRPSARRTREHPRVPGALRLLAAARRDDPAREVIHLEGGCLRQQAAQRRDNLGYDRGPVRGELQTIAVEMRAAEQRQRQEA